MPFRFPPTVLLPPALISIALIMGGCDESGPQFDCTQNNQCFFPDVCVDGLCVLVETPDGGELDAGSQGIDADTVIIDPCAVDGTDCDDGNPCTHSDRCLSGRCLGTAYTCNDGNVCTNDSCDGDGTCTFQSNTRSCNDDNACTHSDRCGGGSCQGVRYSCDDGNACTNDSCNGDGTCRNANNTRSCNDGNTFTENDRCSGGGCSGSACGSRGQSCCGSTCRSSLSCESGTCRRCTTSNPRGSGSAQLECFFSSIQSDGNRLNIFGQREGGRDQDCQGNHLLGTLTMQDVTFSGTGQNSRCRFVSRFVGNGNEIQLFGPREQGRDQDCQGSFLTSTIAVSGATVDGTVNIDCGLHNIRVSGNSLIFSGGIEDGRGECSRSGTIGSLTFNPVRTCS